MTVPELLDTIRTHLAQFELPELCSVTVTASTRALQVSGQLACQEAPEIAAALLAWADTLTDLAGQAWRVPDGSSVHLSITGRLPCGTSVQVYSGVP
ncbi:MAG TPA: hypothetical protein VHH34_03915, partial [Pseudonocardiaceae bacterium]|nr:hypothetical protein [Pseudonocardiaceae bacterium]